MKFVLAVSILAISSVVNVESSCNEKLSAFVSYAGICNDRVSIRGVAFRDRILPVYGFFSPDEEADGLGGPEGTNESSRRRIRDKVTWLAKSIVVRPISTAAPMPRAIVEILKDATQGAVELAVDEVMSRRNQGINTKADPALALSVADLIDEAFSPMEASLDEMEVSLKRARLAMQDAKAHARQAIEAVQAAAIAQTQGAATAVAAAEETAAQKVMAEMYDIDQVDLSSLKYEDVGYHQSEMAPPFLDEAQCLIPGEAVVRVEKAPENSRRIFAGIDIPVSVDTVWNVLTDYSNLQKVVPNLVVNQVLELYDGSPSVQPLSTDASQPAMKQCQALTKQLKGAKLRQVGGAKVAGINFSARTTLEVREWPQGMPDFAHFQDPVFEGKTRDARVSDNARVKLERYKFPRPFALSTLPTRDISMQSVENDNGEFRMYQGVWRMQPLPGCAPEGKDAMRLTYAVEVSPRAYLPVSIIEGRIVNDLCTNLAAIRDFVTAKTAVGANST